MLRGPGRKRGCRRFGRITNPLRVCDCLPVTMSAWAYPRVRGLAAPTTNMGRPHDDHNRRPLPMRSRRRRAWFAVLSAVAGGGTAAVLGGPLAGGALGAVVP